MGKYSDSDLAWFYLFCPPSVSELLLGDHGLSVCDIDFSGSIMGMSVTTALKISGNESAFRWLRENRPDELKMAQFKLQELVDTPLVIPLLEEAKDGSLSSPKLYEAMKDMIAHRKIREAIALEPKLKLTEAKAKELLAFAERSLAEEGVGLGQLASALKNRILEAEAARKPSAARKKKLSWNPKRINELVSFAEHGDIASMREYLKNVGEGELPDDGPLDDWCKDVPKAHYRLWRAVLDSFDINLLEFLVSKGLRLRSMPYFLSAVTTASCSCGASTESARALLMAALEAGARCEGCRIADVSEVLRMFPGDCELFDRLCASGMPLCWETPHYEKDELDAELIVGALKCREDGEAAWGSIAYLLNRGVTIAGASPDADRIWDMLDENPGKAAVLVENVPPNTITPSERLLPIVAASGSIAALSALESWKGAYTSGAVDLAIGRAAAEGMTEAVAYMLERRNAGEACAGSLCIDDDDSLVRMS